MTIGRVINMVPRVCTTYFRSQSVSSFFLFFFVLTRKVDQQAIKFLTQNSTVGEITQRNYNSLMAAGYHIRSHLLWVISLDRRAKGSRESSSGPSGPSTPLLSENVHSEYLKLTLHRCMDWYKANNVEKCVPTTSSTPVLSHTSSVLLQYLNVSLPITCTHQVLHQYPVIPLKWFR